MKNICIVGSSCSFGDNICSSLQDSYSVHKTTSKELNVTSPTDIEKYFTKFDQIHGLVYCPAIKNKADALADPSILHQLLSVNLFGAISCMQNSIHKMKNGKMVIIGSADGTFGNYKNTMYSVSKAALHQYTKCLATQFRETGNETICLVLGTIKNDDEKNAIADFIKGFMDNKIRNLNGQLIRMDGGHHTFPL